MPSDHDFWRKQQEDRKRDDYYDALRNRDTAGLVRSAASTEAYIEYLQHGNGAATEPPASFEQGGVSLAEAKQQLLFDIMTSPRLDLSVGISCLHEVESIDLSKPDAAVLLVRMRRFIEGRDLDTGL